MAMSPGRRPSPSRDSHGHASPAARMARPRTISALRMSIAGLSPSSYSLDPLGPSARWLPDRQRLDRDSLKGFPMPTARYNCSKCPGYCCSYPIIPLTKTDLKRLARHFGLGVRAAAAKFTVTRGEDKYTMRRKADPHFGRVCQFFDTKQRNCTIYGARPSACRRSEEHTSELQ